MRILIIEDSKTVASYLADLLKKDKCETSIAHTGEQAKKKLESEQFNLVLLDLTLPDMDGSELLQEIRQIKNSLELPVIVLSATKDYDKIVQVLDLQANDFLTKPVDVITLSIKVKNLLDVQRLNTKVISSAKKIAESEKKLKELNSTKDKFISILAHDLKNPFNTILGFSELLIKNIDNYDNENIKKIAQTIYASTENTYNLLLNLLEWSRSQQNEITFNPEIFNLYDITQEIYTFLNDMAKRKGIDIELNIPEELKIKADKEMIKIVIRNLVSNSIKYTNAKGKVKISAKQLNDKISLEIADTGIGMSKYTISTLFKVGETKSELGTNDERGTGFGLLLCKEFTEKHKGQINIESELGNGSKFTVILPSLKTRTNS